MDFFERQDKARRSTKWLAGYFVAGVTLLIVTIYLAVLVVFVGASTTRRQHYGYGEPAQVEWWNAKLFLVVAAGTLAVIGLGSASKTMELAQGGSAVATMLGGRPISPSTTDPDERKVLNVVEEMAIASGVPVPQVYLLPDERGINAFAAGHSTSDAVIGVTEGSAKLLTRDELQGVIAHEFSHIVNGDMRLNIRLIGIVFGLVCIAVIGRVLLQIRSRDSRDRNPLPLLGLILVVLGWIGVVFGRLIQAAVSRQRELLADASAVQYTRNPEGLAGALKKIGGLSYGSKLEAAHAEEASHIFFGNGLGESMFHLMDTHPPLAERIRALEPNFDGVFVPVSLAPERPVTPVSPPPCRAPIPFGSPRQAGVTAAIAGFAAPPMIPAGSMASGTGSPTTAHLRYAEDLRNAIPPELQSAAREAMGASALIYALLLSQDEPARRKQLDELAGATGPALVQETLRLLPAVEKIAAKAKLPLADLALPGLRQLSPGQFQQFRAAVQALVESDGEIDLFEYVLQKIVLRHLTPHYAGARKPLVQFYALKPLAADCAVLLSALACAGQQEQDKRVFAFEQGARQLRYAANAGLEFLADEQCGLERVDAALDRLAQAAPQIKKNVLDACAQTVAADGIIEEAEAELLRATADTLDCPLPPFIQSALAVVSNTGN
jgi:Zn-dependent protease with chaperone function